MSTYNCGCSQVQSCNGCPINLDFSCSTYNKDNNALTALTNLSLNNGATLKLFAEAVDLKMGQLNVPEFALNCLRQTYNVNTLRQFAEAVDIRLCEIKGDIEALQAAGLVPITATSTSSIALVASGTNFHTLSATLQISEAANNLASLLSDGLYSAPQTLNVNYTTKELSISQGNTVSLASLICGVGGFLGNQAADPTSVIDGQYWWNTTSSQLKIKVGGAIKVIVTT